MYLLRLKLTFLSLQIANSPANKVYLNGSSLMLNISDAEFDTASEKLKGKFCP